MSTCQYCSEEVEPSAVKCRHCGEPLVAKKPEKAKDDLSQVIGWVFEDPNWVVKIIIGTASLLFGCFLFMLPLFALIGFKFRIARQQQRAPGISPMPEWDDFGSLILDGLKEFVALFCVGMLLVGSLLLLAGLGVGVDVLLTGQPGGLFTAITVGVAYLLLMIGALGMTYFVPAIELEFLETGSPFSSLHFGSVWRRVTKRPGDYFLLFIYHFVIQMIGSFGAILLYAPVVWGIYTQGAILGRYLAQQRAKDAALGLEP